MKTFKKTSALISVILVLAIIAGLFTSCSGKNAVESTDENTQTVSENEMPTAETGEAAGVKDAAYYRNLPTLEATEGEIESLCSMLVFFEEYDCDAEDALKKALINLLSLFGNYAYYTHNAIEPIDGQDPLGKFVTTSAGLSYWKYPAETVDKLLRSGYNVEPDHDCEIRELVYDMYGCHIYYYDGYYYSCYEVGGGIDILEITEAYIKDGKYHISISCRDYDTKELFPAYEITAKLFDFDGARKWNFEKVDSVNR